MVCACSIIVLKTNMIVRPAIGLVHVTSIYAVNNQNFYYSWHRYLENTFSILNFSHFPWCFLYKHSAKCRENSTHHLFDSPPVLESVPHL